MHWAKTTWEERKNSGRASLIDNDGHVWQDVRGVFDFSGEETAHRMEYEAHKKAQSMALTMFAHTKQHDKNWAFKELQRLSSVRSQIVVRANHSRRKYFNAKACAHQAYHREHTKLLTERNTKISVIRNKIVALKTKMQEAELQESQQITLQQSLKTTIKNIEQKIQTAVLHVHAQSAQVKTAYAQVELANTKVEELKNRKMELEARLRKTIYQMTEVVNSKERAEAIKAQQVTIREEAYRTYNSTNTKLRQEETNRITELTTLYESEEQRHWEEAQAVFAKIIAVYNAFQAHTSFWNTLMEGDLVKIMNHELGEDVRLDWDRAIKRVVFNLGKKYVHKKCDDIRKKDKSFSCTKPNKFVDVTFDDVFGNPRFGNNNASYGAAMGSYQHITNGTVGIDTHYNTQQSSTYGHTNFHAGTFKYEHAAYALKKTTDASGAVTSTKTWNYDPTETNIGGNNGP